MSVIEPGSVLDVKNRVLLALAKSGDKGTMTVARVATFAGLTPYQAESTLRWLAEAELVQKRGLGHFLTGDGAEEAKRLAEGK